MAGRSALNWSGLRPMATIKIPNNWTPRPYQMPLWSYLERGGKRAISIAHRRWGKDDVLLHRTAVAMLERPASYWHMLPAYAQARKAIWSAVNPRTGKRRIDEAFPRELRESTNEQEMFIRLKNGATWQCVGSDRYDSLVGAGVAGVTFSEWALANPSAWGYIRPMLEENDGWAAFITCVSPSTLVLGESGLVSMDELMGSNPQGYSGHNARYYGLGGFHDAVECYRGPKQRTLKFRTAKGFEIECTPVHPLWTGTEWRRAAKWRVGDSIPIQLDQQVFGSEAPDAPDGLYVRKPSPQGAKCKPNPFVGNKPDWYYFLGLVCAEGSWTKHIANISNQDPDIIEFLERYGFKHRGGARNENANSNLVAAIEAVGMRKGAKNKDIPRLIRALPREYLVEFIRGYFDGDGCARKDGGVYCTSVSDRLTRQIQVILLNFGIVSARRPYVCPPTKRVKVESRGWRIEIEGHMAARFFDRIGFRLERKQERRAALSDRQIEQRQDRFYIPDGAIPDHYWSGLNAGDVKRQAKRGTLGWCTIEKLHARRPLAFFEKILDDGFHYDSIVSVEESESEVFDFVIPETHSFFSNGFVSHNTPRGRNHAKDLYDYACSEPGWFSERSSIHDTQALTPEKIEESRREYIALYGEDIGQAQFEQEYLVSFNAAILGAFYAREMLDVRNEGRIDPTLEAEPSILVHRAWDIGVRDDTTIWFFQVVGSQVYLLDCYSGTGAGVDHYAEIIEKKYSKHGWKHGWDWVPHDAKVKEWGTGKTRVETMKALGLRPHVVPNAGLLDGINAARLTLPRCVFHPRCEDGINALEMYRREWDDAKKVFKANPLHDFSSHYADAFRYMAMAWREMVPEPVKKKPHVAATTHDLIAPPIQEYGRRRA